MRHKRKKLDKADLLTVFAGQGQGTVMSMGVFRPPQEEDTPNQQADNN